MAPELILDGLTSIANDWKGLAIAWHLVLATLCLMLVAGWRPSAPLLGASLALMMMSVSAVAWLSGNPVNGTIFGILSVLIAAAARRCSSAPICIAKGPPAVAGVALVVFGWIYPHFLGTNSWATYLYAAPFGLLPCPTLSVMIGLALLIDDVPSPLWTGTLVLAGLFYGGFGVFRLGVQLDWALLAGCAVLAVVGVRDRRRGGEPVRRHA